MLRVSQVIPYIASQFRKDKIWLRRTRPSKRQYQVMLAIDDSQSMADNRAGQLACEALVTICKAMSKLEVRCRAQCPYRPHLPITDAPHHPRCHRPAHCHRLVSFLW